MKHILKSTLAALGLACALSAAAAPIIPTFTTFGTLAGATFGGSGIPNNAVAITNLTGLTLGLTATPRFFAPSPTNNGLGVFNALAGVSPNPPSSAADPYALWNFSFFAGGTAVANTFFRLFYDFNGAIGNDQNTHGVIGFAGNAAGTPSQNSFNLGMDFLAVTNSFPGVVAPAPASVFNPNAAGQYTFALAAYASSTGAELGRSAIVVNVQAVPEPGTFALAGLALLGLAAARRRT